ncbi:MAG TPA: MinD/ParA family protein [Bryobacterales bacterium]|nr:MinD/ParA family protein [Bryobacterales bacterium]
MSKIISVHSFRGGTGKSNLTANLAVAVARMGRRVGVIDTDIQSPGIHVIFGLTEEEIKYSLNDFLWGKCSIEQAAYDVAPKIQREAGGKGPVVPPFHLIPASLKQREIVRIVDEGYDVSLLNSGFHDAIERLELEYLFIDTHPGVNDETLLSIAVCDLLLVVIRPDNQDFQGTAVTVELARQLKVREMMMLVNKVPSDLETRALRGHLERTYGMPVPGVFPLNVEVVQLASSGLFSVRFPEHPFSRQIEIVAERIAATPSG